MTIQKINIGNAVNDGLGDNLREAFVKVNDNFTELGNNLITTARNLNNSEIGIFAQKVGAELQFKTLRGAGITSSSTSITVNAFTTLETDNTVVQSSNHPSISVKGGENISVVSNGANITIDTKSSISQVLTSFDFGQIGDSYSNILELLVAVNPIDFGTILNPADLSLDLGGI
jgi:hypothetical protein